MSPRALLAAGLLLAAPLFVSANPIRQLAPDHVVVGESPDPANQPLYSPTILRLDSGRLVAGYTLSSRDDTPKRQFLLTSDDAGLTWQKRAELPFLQGRVFRAGKSLYYLATGPGLPIARSDDHGTTWTSGVHLSPKDQVWQQTPANVWHAKGHVYLAYERAGRRIDAWGPSEKELVLLRAPETADLTRPSSWTLSSSLAFADVLPGVRQNAPAIDFVGIPFLPQAYPSRNRLAPGRSMSPIGWVEPAVLQITDPDHYWFDPSGNTFHLLARAHTGGTGFAALAKVVENPDGTMTMSLETAPSGQKMLFLPVPGGHLRFHVLYDAQTKLFWLLGSQATDSMTRADRLPPERFDLPNNERHRLVLHHSRNLVDWVFAGLVAKTDNPREARHYASMDIDGDDLVILSRSGDSRARSAHDGNLVTFHRVKNFRDLVY